MEADARPVKAKVEARSAVAGKSQPFDGSTGLQLAQRLAEASAQHAAVSEILQVISASPSDVQPVLDAVAERAARLCDAPLARVLLVDGDVLRAMAEYSLDGTSQARTVPLPCRRTTIVGRAVLDRVIIHHDDVVPLLDSEYPDALNARQLGLRAVLAVPLMREGNAYGVVLLWRREPGLFAPEQVALVQTFAQQAAIAVDNVRLFKATKEALEQQTATSEILRVISQSPTDAQPVFKTIVRSALSLCNATHSGVYLLDGETLSLAAAEGLAPDDFARFASGFPRKIGPDTVTGRAALECRVVQTPDLIDDPQYSSAPGSRVGARSVLGVPLIRDGKAIGSIGVWRAEVRLFSDTEIALLRTFADQAVIAIENVRLFTELEARNHDLTEALEHQTATGEILRVISSSPTDVQPVFEIISSRAGKLCDAEISMVTRVDGEQIHLAAIHGVTEEAKETIRRLHPMPLSIETATARAIRGRGIVHISDVMDDPLYGRKDAATVAGWRGCLAVPMLREGQVIGAIFVARTNPGLFADSKIELLKTFADQAVIAIENVRLFTELDARTTQLTRSVGELKALGEVGQAVSSTLDLETVLSTIASRATALAGMDAGAIYEYDEVRGEFYLHTADRLPDEVVTALRAGPIPKGEGALGRMAMTGDPTQIHDIMTDASYQSRLRGMVLRLGYRSLMAVPLTRDDHLLGGLVVYRKTPGEFDASVIDLLKTFASQSALAIQNARLFREIAEKSRALEKASRHKSEFLANMSHELRTPLNAIIGFSEVLSERMFGEINEKQAEYIGDILQSGQHLLSLINDILDLSKIEAGRMELELTDFDLPSAIENTLMLVRERAHRRAITLARNIDERLAMIRGDERKVKQVLLNLLSNALKFTPEGGKIGVQAELRDGAAEISVTDTGVGIAPEDQEAVFEEFRQVGTASKKVEGTGLGLAISRKFIELHGGRIWVESQFGKGSTFAFTLPLQ